MDKITPKRLVELERAEKKLHALEAGGVDNWDNYDSALAEYRAEVEGIEQREALLDDIIQLLGETAYEPSERGAGIAFHEDAENKCMKLLEKYGVFFKGGEG
jgi:hypothetical protein